MRRSSYKETLSSVNKNFGTLSVLRNIQKCHARGWPGDASCRLLTFSTKRHALKGDLKDIYRNTFYFRSDAAAELFSKTSCLYGEAAS
jgi:hypothetical protein